MVWIMLISNVSPEKTQAEFLKIMKGSPQDKEGDPLRGLLRVLEEQVDMLENDISHLYDNLFIETSEDWVITRISVICLGISRSRILAEP